MPAAPREIDGTCVRDGGFARDALWSRVAQVIYGPALLLRVGAGGRLPETRTAVFLNLLFVLTQLHFNLVNHAVDGCHQIRRLFLRDEVVLVLRIDAQLHVSIIFMLKVDGQFDFHHPIEEPDQLFQLCSELFLGRFAQLAVACRDLGLHRDALSLKTKYEWSGPSRSRPTSQGENSAVVGNPERSGRYARNDQLIGSRAF